MATQPFTLSVDAEAVEERLRLARQAAAEADLEYEQPSGLPVGDEPVAVELRAAMQEMWLLESMAILAAT